MNDWLPLMREAFIQGLFAGGLFGFVVGMFVAALFVQQPTPVEPSAEPFANADAPLRRRPNPNPKFRSMWD